MRHWFWRKRHHHHYREPKLWLIVNTIAVELKPNQEIIMAQTLRIDEIDNLSIATLDASGNPVTVTFDSPPSWVLSDPSSSGATLVPSADGLTAVLTPGTVGSAVTVNLTAAVGGKSFSASLDVTAEAGAVASIQIVATPAPKP